MHKDINDYKVTQFLQFMIVGVLVLLFAYLIIYLIEEGNRITLTEEKCLIYCVKEYDLSKFEYSIADNKVTCTCVENKPEVVFDL